MPETDPDRIGERLGVSAGAVRRLQARGYLRSLELSDDEIRYRLWRGHLAASTWPHVVTARGRWTWILPPARFADDEANRCGEPPVSAR